MKNKILLSSLIISLVFLPQVSGAVEVETDASAGAGTGPNSATIEARVRAKTEMEEKREELKNKAEENRQTIKANIEAKKEAVKNAVDERRQNATDKVKERLDQFVQNLKERFDAAVERLEKLSLRIDSRISKLEAEGVDVSKSKEIMVDAKAKIEIARTSILAISVDQNASTTNALKEYFPTLKSAIEKAKGDVKAAHAALVDAVNSLKPGQERLEAKMKVEAGVENDSNN